MPTRFFVYALKDPRDQSVCYIGKSCGGLEVARRHVWPSSLRISHNPRKNAWIEELKALGLQYQIEILEEFTSGEGVGMAEREWIAQAWRLGAPLFNLTEGGENEPGRKHSQETIAKIAATKTGRTLSDEHRKNISKSGMALWQSSGFRERAIAARVGRVLSSETKVKIGAKRKGQRHTEATKIKMRAAKQNMSAETRARMSASAKARWESV